jgi:hypothetical protein
VPGHLIIRKGRMPEMTENTGSFPPPYTEYPAQQETQHQAAPSTAEAARDQAAAVGRSASEAGSQVAQTAADQARVVASETARQARDLLGEAGGQVRGQASVQQQNAARQLRGFADELQEMAAKSGQPGLATEVAQQAADRLHGSASWLEQREPADVLDAVRDFARRRPGTFLLGAAVAGLVAGRLTRGVTDASRSGDQDRYRQAGRRPGAAGQIPSAAAIPPPAEPDWTTPVPDYSPGTVPGTAGMPEPGATAWSAPYDPAGGAPGTGVSETEDEIATGRRYEDRPGSGPAAYRPGQP